MEIYQFQQLIEKRMDLTLENGHGDRLIPENVQTHFLLSSHEIFLLCAVAAAQTDGAIMRQFQYASGLNATLFPAWFYAEMLQSNELTPRNILEMLAPDRPLRMYSLIEVGSRNEWGFKVPIFQAPLCVPQRMISYLMGYDMRNHLEYAEIIEPTKETVELVYPAGFKKNVLRALRNRNARIALWGPKGFGRRSLIREFAAAQNLKIIEIDASCLSDDENPEHLAYIMGEWFREARLLNAIMIFRCDNVKSPNVLQAIENVLPQFKRILDLHFGIICILAKNSSSLISRLFGEYTEFKCTTPPQIEQLNLWRLALKNNLSGEKLDDAVDYISSSYCMTMGEIKDTISTCCSRFMTSEPTGPELAETLRVTRGHELEGLAELKSTPLGLKDIVLSTELREKINEILNFARYSEFVTKDWDFRRMSTATGLGVLFWGTSWDR